MRSPSMLPEKEESPNEKSGLHPRSKHRERYDFKKLIVRVPELESFVKLNEYNDESIDFFDPKAVKLLNKALLKHFYKLEYWEIPTNYLCPPVPGRAEYIHHVADLLGSQYLQSGKNKIPKGNRIKCLDVGMGANCIYPIIGCTEYGWSFVGSDIDPVSIASASKIVEMNSALRGHVDCRLQGNAHHIFKGIIHDDEIFDVTICNPPFHASAADAQSGTIRKLSNLKHKKITNPILNFGGMQNEIWCEGGEEMFTATMIQESKRFALSCFWFTTLVSKQATLTHAYKALKIAGALEVKTIPIRHGNKTSRILAWTFLAPDQKNKWVKTRWS